MLWILVVLRILLNGASCLDLNFPPGFKFGAATAAYQVEGGWNASDKSESIWDRALHGALPKDFPVGVTGDVACDSYHHWRRDVEMVQEMGLQFYRFSISWPRLLPNAFPTKISESGKKYYDDLINYVLEKGIEPMVTIYHWDLPQKLQDLGGWTNPLISDWFADYARVVFSLYADRVKTWITINEPHIMCNVAYNGGMYAPLIVEPEMGALLCDKHTLLAHAKAWRIYDEQYKPIYHGKMTLSNFLTLFIPKTKSDEDVTELARQCSTGQYSHPIYSKEGGWPPLIEKAMAEYSKKAGYPRSKLPAFSNEEISLIRGTYDFYALNYYTTRLVRRANPGEDVGYWPYTGHPDYGLVLEMDPTWAVTQQLSQAIYPEGLRKNIAWLREQYGDMEFIISENGCADGHRNDYERMNFIRSHLEQVLLSIHEDGANITGFTYWSLMDNYEWQFGYDVAKFGLYEVNFKDPMRRRRPRASAHYYSHIVGNHSLDVAITQEFNTSDFGNNSSNIFCGYNYLIGLFLIYLAYYSR